MCLDKKLTFYLFILFLLLIDFTRMIKAKNDEVDLEVLPNKHKDNFKEFSKNLDNPDSLEDSKLLSRSKRQLIFPVQTLVQFSLCLVSTADAKRNIFVNQGFQLNWLTPNRTNQLPSTFFLVPPVINARSREKRDDESYDNAPLLEEVTKFFDGISTEQIYYLIEMWLNHKGYNGTACLLHSICQMSTIPLHQDGDIFHEIMQFILTPSEHSDLHSDKESDTSRDDEGILIEGYATIRNPTALREYHRAEILGRSYLNDHKSKHCDEYYTCPDSPLDKITHIVFEDD